MPVTSVTIQNINPQYNPPNPFTPPTQLQQVQVSYNGTAPGPANGVMTLYAQRVDPITGVPVVPADIEAIATATLSPNTESSSISFQNVPLTNLADTTYRFFATVTQSNGGTVSSALTNPYPVNGDDVICFLTGARIRTPAGEVAVEDLRIGDLVLTADGRAEPILFIGRQAYSTRFAGREDSWPVRIRAGALAEGVPSADLHVSPMHALHIDGVLILAKALQNGSTIAQVAPPAETFTYYSLELTRHEVILAEGAEAESFADHVSRTRFHNHAEFAALYPEGRVVGEMDAPHAKSARQVPAPIRARIAERAALLDQACGTTRAA
jgi:hypothetical protein